VREVKGNWVVVRERDKSQRGKERTREERDACIDTVERWNIIMIHSRKKHRYQSNNLIQLPRQLRKI